ncbi:MULTISPECIES: anhydro-N-acetylmuramic acid kinase [Brevundimonas]|jgi:anhydro-N-acetylmuramic acid kinase|uniref:anhydro-N-acetylmuramic acid kinase n=1 Tax=Brevundimonas TaxID=41275 RepID=UPI0019052212|nr:MULTISPECIES: anhydro-N-acetylmuramic acid kinase [Brevundimonas]MDA0742573.1 anhydro-N-acetylmuramic acid kinase [Pseudomonadota bacterium]MBK1969533.1 anhydro-N-acetylmuramic acid kinase [Brevundimonas diminuta]MBK1975314.1 anhydro-N-acetylmuramic acid kinase [Brevundimonas diminuta]MDA1321720.1 anhydro-N-acetylmuramic acid kinase [Pseudomonadota bacterium]MDM8352075.1 anhydro-N-acetylmuramic acid kinase [Brevundimonas diminuta]
MTTSPKKTLRVLGFMTGTSLDAVDMAVIETDGHDILSFGPAGEMKLDGETRAIVEDAIEDAFDWERDEEEPDSFEDARMAVADAHLAAALGFMAVNGVKSSALDLVGVHGQTVLHEAPTHDAPGRTVQLIDAVSVAEGLSVPVAYDFRSADVAAGGQGAPLAPVYHAALVRKAGVEGPVAVLNLGGVGNITLIRADGGLEAFDTGPANGMVDLLVQSRMKKRMDEGGRLAAAGTVDPAALDAYLAHPYFAATGPKSLDRFDFSLDPVAELSLEDAAATLTAFAAQAVALGVARCSEQPKEVVVCGGGRHNPVLLAAIRERVGVPVSTAEDKGWRGDSIEAEAFAFLAARCRLGLPISFPGTTGVAAPMTGGRIVEPGAE